MNRKEFIHKSTLTGLGFLGLWGKSTALNTQEDYANNRKEFCLDKDVIYLNNGTMGISPASVEEEVIRQIKIRNSDGRYGGGETQLKKKLSGLLRIQVDEIGLTQNVTHGINNAIHALDLSASDEVLITTHEHVGNAAPWLNRKRQVGFKISPIPTSSSSEEALESIKSNITPKTRVLALPHVTCTTGQVYPIKEICALAKSKGILTLIDGAHGPGMMDLDLKDIDCDMYISCMHKWMLGPAGLGFMYVRKELLPSLNPAFAGHFGLKSWSTERADMHFNREHESAEFFQYGTHNGALYYGGATAIDFLNKEGMVANEAYIRGLNQYLLDGLLENQKKLKILTPVDTPSRVGILSFKMNNDRDLDFQKFARSQKMILRYVRESQLNCVRVSTHIYNTKSDIDKMLELLKTFL